MEIPINKIEKISALRQSVQKIKEGELAKKAKKETYNPHFDGINPEELDEIDLEIYEKIANKLLTREELEKYQKEKYNNESRKLFAAWMNNQLMRGENVKWFDPKEYEENKEIYESID